MSTSVHLPESFGGGRFETVRRLGQGAIGVVYLVRDRVRKRLVALKQLRSLEPKYLYRFKREFRAASQISHPNVVCLYELMEEQGDWFFTMEYVPGRHFLEAVCDRAARPLRSPCTQETRSLIGGQGIDGSAGLECGSWVPVTTPRNPALPHLSDRLDLAVLRSALRQLADAIGAIHAQGILHRDIKPSNVMVTDEGRVVLADFSIALKMQQRHSRARTEDGVVLGTPAFMAPEQIYPRTITPAVDWYAFGAMMYVALTGTFPHQGEALTVLRDKQTDDAISPRHYVSGIPEELEDLCMRLLQRNAKERPQLSEVLEVLSEPSLSDPASSAYCAAYAVNQGGSLFIGRRRELARLHEVRSQTSEDGPRCVLVQGPCGIGKSRLLAQFKRELADDADVSPLVLTIRCHEREKIPYNAFDGVFEQVGQFLNTFSDEQLASVVDDWEALTAVFPCIRYAVRRLSQAAHGHERSSRLRDRGYGALRNALTALLRHQSLVICIDDLHWADTESLELLMYLMKSPILANTPGLFMVAAFSSDIMGEFHNLQFAEFVTSVLRHSNFIHLPLAPLSEREQRLMLASAVESELDLSEAGDLLVQSDGYPRLLGEIAHRVNIGAELMQADVRGGLRPMLWEHLQSLDKGARTLASLISLAGESLPMHVLVDAMALSTAETERALASLCAQQLTRISYSGDEVWVDVYHEAVRAAVRQHLSPADMRSLLGALLSSLENWQSRPTMLLQRHRELASDAGIMILAHHEHHNGVPTLIVDESGSAGCSLP